MVKGETMDNTEGLPTACRNTLGLIGTLGNVSQKNNITGSGTESEHLRYTRLSQEEGCFSEIIFFSLMNGVHLDA